MAYKTLEKIRDKALEYYYANREKVLDYQKKRWNNKYANDVEFRKKRQLRDASRMRKEGLRSLKDQKCVLCSSSYDLQRHHPSYESTAVVIMCRSCHNSYHVALREAEGTINVA